MPRTWHWSYDAHSIESPSRFSWLSRFMLKLAEESLQSRHRSLSVFEFDLHPVAIAASG